MISQETIDSVREAEEERTKLYLDREARAEKVEEVKQFLLIAGLTETQVEPLAEKLTALFVPEIPRYL